MSRRAGMGADTGRLSGAALLAAALIAVAPAMALDAPPLAPEQEKVLKQNFALCVAKLKGPYTENICVCPNGTKRPIRSASGALGAACEKPIFCAAYRASWAEALARQRLYIGNIFSRDVYEWNGYADHNDVVRGYVLEKHFTDTHPKHKLAQLRAFRGLASSEDELPASAVFFERYLAAPEFDAARHFLLAYELQKRFLNRADVRQIERLRAAATRVESMDKRFKPLKDAIHNQVSAGLVPQLAAYRDALPEGAERRELQAIIDQIQMLTAIDESALAPALAALQDAALRTKLEGLVPAAHADAVEAISALAQLMVAARQAVEAKSVAPAEARRLIDLDIVAGTVLQQRTTALLKSGTALTAGQYLQLLAALTNATYASGLLTGRERDDALTGLSPLLANPRPSGQELRAGLGQAKRVIEWAQANATLPFAEVWAPWTAVLPEVATIGDDILRGSPLRSYAEVLEHLDDVAAGSEAPAGRPFSQADAPHRGCPLTTRSQV